jgi:DNA polymerase III subunit epsilon
MMAHGPGSASPVISVRARSFAAIDFETATQARNSACAVSVAVVDDGQLSGVDVWLIRPPGNEYDAFNTMLHGIGPADTESAPPFADVFPQVLEFIGGRPVVAHYAPFDLGVIREAHLDAGVAWPELTVACTVVLSRRAWPGQSSYSLPVIASYLQIDAFRHHDPRADAVACAEIARHLLAATETETLHEAAERLGVRLGTLRRDQYEPCLANYRRGVKGWGLTRPSGEGLDPDHPFFGVGVTFTGTLDSMPRRQAAQLVLDVGGEFCPSVSRKTRYLVFGWQDFTRFTDGLKSSKTRKAEQLIRDGHPLEIIGEDLFLRMLG